MESDSYEGTSDGRVRRSVNESTVEIKQEPDVKEEPLDQVEWVTRAAPVRVGDIIMTDSDLKLEVDTDDECDFQWYSMHELDSVKEEEKCEDGKKKKKKEKDSVAASDSNGRAANNCGCDDQNEPLATSKDGEKKAKANKNKNNRSKQKKQNQSKVPKTPSTKDVKKHKCTFCNYSTSRKSQLTVHIRVHTGEKPFCCEICSKVFTQKTNLNRHKRTHGELFSFRCLKCRQGFDCEQKKNEHENQCKVRRYECELCKYSTEYKQHLEMHMRIHNGGKPFKCMICFKTFTDKSHLAAHSRIHNDGLPFACSKCGQNFANEQSKQSHEERCARRRYECYLCQYKSFAKINLKQHMRAIHTGEKPNQCVICKKYFVRKDSLSFHMATHRELLPFQCSKCPRAFSNNNEKVAHDKVCRGRQYQCYICKDLWNVKTNLQYHVKSQHSGDKPFGCQFCDARFIMKYAAKKHMKDVHEFIGVNSLF